MAAGREADRAGAVGPAGRDFEVDCDKGRRALEYHLVADASDG